MLTHKTELGGEFRWIYVEIHYTYDKPHRGVTTEGQHYCVGGQLNIHQVDVLLMEGYDLSGHVAYARRQGTFGTWAQALDAYAMDRVLNEVEQWGWLADELVDTAEGEDECPY